MRVRLAIYAVLCSALAASAEVQVSATVDRNVITVSETVQLQVTLQGADSAPSPVLKDLSGLRVLQGPFASTHVSYINGQVSRSVTYTYVLAPSALGKQSIGAVEVTVGNRVYRTNPVVIEVVNEQQAQQGAPQQNLFVVVQSDKTTAYLNDQVLVTLTLCFKDLDVRQVTPPDLAFEGFESRDVGPPVQERRVIDNVVYDTVRFQKLLVPIKAGTFTVGPVPVTISIREQLSRQQRGVFGDDFFGGGLMEEFFGRYRVKEQIVQSRPLTIAVSAPPAAGRPASFSGAVGTFSLTAVAEPAGVVVGEPVTLTVEIAGQGNIESAAVSLPTNAPGFRTYVPEATKTTTTEGGRLAGRKIYKQVWVPTELGATSIPPVSFSFFDPQRAAYTTLSQGPFNLALRAAADQQKPLMVTEARVSAVPSDGRVRVLQQDIFTIKNDSDGLGSPRRAYRSAAFTATVALPPCVWLACTLLAGWQRRLAHDTAFARRLNANRNAEKRLRAARAALRARDGAAFYAALSDALTHCIADRLHITAPQVTTAALPGLFAGAAVPADVRAQIAQLLDECDFGRFASSGFSAEAAGSQLAQCARLVKSLAQHLR